MYEDVVFDGQILGNWKKVSEWVNAQFKSVIFYEIV